MFGIVYKHNRNGKLELVYYFENVTLAGRKISGVDQQSRVVMAKIHEWKGLTQLDLQSYEGQYMTFPWYDKVFFRESVVDLIEFAEEEPQLLELCALLYQRV